MIGVVIPAHNKQDFLVCVASNGKAASNPRLYGALAEIVVVADACTERTEALAAQSGARLLPVSFGNVGAAHPADARSLDAGPLEAIGPLGVEGGS